jgi:sialic acid synthase SpsE
MSKENADAPTISVAGRKIGGDAPCYVIAEVSCNHEGSFEEARRIIEAAAACGADAAKIQTYAPDTITTRARTRATGTIWADVDLHKIYSKAQTPWDWHRDLAKVATDNGLHFFSSPFDETAVDHLEKMDVPVYKLASFEMVDTRLIAKIASTGKPVIASNGMTDYLELDEAVRTLRANGCAELALLHCNSGYPALFAEANLRTIPALAGLYNCPVGLSDHTLFADADTYSAPMAHVAPLEAVRLGAKIVEVHLTLDRARGRALMEKQEGGFDWPFSREPEELKRMIAMIRAHERGETVEYETAREKETAALTHGAVCFEPTAKELASRSIRPSLWVVEDIKAGEPLVFAGGRKGNVDSLRPGGGLHIRFADFIDGRRAACDIPAGTPLAWQMVAL